MVAITASVEDTDEITQIRKGIAGYVYARTGAHISDATVGCVIDEARVHAIQRGVGLVDAARDLCRITSEHLHKHNSDAGAALTTVDAAIGIDGVALLVLIIAQKRIHTREGTI
jgi:hypothetical protein